MRREDIIVEVRNRALERRGTITTKYLDLAAHLRWSNVGEWTVTLPSGHPMVGELIQEGSGLIVSTRIADTPAVPPTYGPDAAVALKNRVGNPDTVSGGSTFSTSGGTGSYTGGKHRFTATGGIAAYLYANPPTSEAVGGRFGVTSGDKYSARVRLTNPNASTVYVRLSLGWYIASGGAAVPGSTSGAITALAAGASTTLELIGVVPTASSGGAVAGTLPVVYLFSTAVGGNPTAGLLLDTTEWALYTGPTAPTASPVAYVSGNLADTPGLDGSYYDFTGTANASTSTLRVGVMTDPGSPAVPQYDTSFSGPTIVPARKRDARNPNGTYTFRGVTDEQHLADARAYPDPTSADPAAQAAANDVRTGPVETLMHEYVAANILPGDAPSGRVRGARAHMGAAVDLGRGDVTQRSPRFDPLLDVLQGLAIYSLGTAEPLGFRMVQVGGELQFQVVPVVDRSDLVRFDIENGTLSSEEVAQSGPNVTYTIVAGQGEGTDRTMVVRTTPESEAAEETWGRVIETFVDQRNTDDLAELQAAGDELLAAGGFTSTSVKAVPSDTTTMRYGIDWLQGDTVGVTVSGQPTTSVVTGVAWIVNKDACQIGAAIGDVSGFQSEDSLTQRVADIDSRVGRIERNEGEEVARLSAAVAYRNLVVNGAFRVNQRGAASAASLASGAYFLDRWKSTAAANAVTWTGDAITGRVLTIPASKSIATILERTDVPAGDYVLSWTGTAQARVYNVGGGAPAYAAGPIGVVLDGAADVTVEFGPGTVSLVSLTPGSTAYPFAAEPYADVLLRCHRYYRRFTATLAGQRVGIGYQYATTNGQAVTYGVPMRVNPTVGFATLQWSDATGFNANVTALSLANGDHTNGIVTLNATFAAGGAALRPGALSLNGVGAYVELSAEL